MANQLFPRDPRRMKQPRKSLLCEQLAATADEIIRLRAQELANEERMESARVALEGEQHG